MADSGSCFFDVHDVDTIASLDIIIKVCDHEKPKFVFFAVPRDCNDVDSTIDIVSYVSISALSPELRKLVRDELKDVS